MNSGASWNERGLSPELYQAARDAALRAGMPVEDWLHATFGKAPAPAPRSQFQDRPAGARLEGIPPQRFESPAPAQCGARLSDTVAKLNARLEQMNGGRASADAGRRAPAETSRPAPPASEDPSLDEVVAEIAARQRALDELAASPATVAPPSLASLEEHLKSIASKIESLRRPCGVEDAVNSLRAELAEIGRTVNDAMPRHALEGLQSDIRSIAQRVEAGLTRGADISALAGIERRLSEVHERLNSMTPAEGLADVDQRIAELARKMDSVGGSSADPEMLRYLEAAITELRELSNGVASAEGLAVLAGDIQALGERIDHVAQTTGAAGLDSLATRVSDLTHALDTRVEQMGPMPQNLASLVKSLTDKLDSADNSPRDQAAFEQLERRIMSLADRLETADQRSGELSAIERGIDQLTLQVREAREEAAATAERVARSVAAETPRGANEDFRRDLEALHAHQAASDERTQQTLEALHETLEHLVERLGNLENGMRSAPAHMAEPVRRAEPARTPEPPAALPAQIPSAPPTVPAARPPAFVPAQRSERTPIDPYLPADTPLEPGAARARSPAERIAASEAALGPALGTLKREGEVTGKANFIAAARRAAQAAASEGATVESTRVEEIGPEAASSSLIGRFLANRRRALVLGVSALLVLYGAVQLAGMFGGSGNSLEPPRMSPSEVRPERPATPENPNRQSAVQPLVAPTPTASLIAPPPTTAVPSAPAAQPVEVTRSVKPAVDTAALAATPADVAPTAPASVALIDRLPAGIAGPALRAAATRGNPNAEFEIGVRFSEGRGAPADLELAAQWFESAANHGLAPAQYRLGSLHEKGQGVKKDLNKARTLYLQAAEKGNAKAIHNLAVLYAEGIDGKPDYQAASQWFRKAATRGVADSQYNLGILYARGIGVDQNLAESFKWFSLAAAQGDADAAKKREDVASRLDQQSLVAARLAVQTFAPDTPPDDAMNVQGPPGGWDQTTSNTPTKPAEKRRRAPTAAAPAATPLNISSNTVR